MKNPLHVVVRFTLKQGELEILVPLIKEFFEKEVNAVPGFISSRIHQNEDGTILINYATWESLESFERFQLDVASVSDISKKIQAFTQTTDKVFEIPFK